MTTGKIENKKHQNEKQILLFYIAKKQYLLKMNKVKDITDLKQWSANTDNTNLDLLQSVASNNKGNYIVPNIPTNYNSAITNCLYWKQKQ